ncbi:hypothetical protein JD844_003130 [Phrynosoma platyrhinos]|uniref:Uncharacterized protein n=1 Tax=Phrynosoma platyrhinos TaxID=52577 RepID=A0ABQ7TDB6_PHRPL|nr:hypothetical protein JD844_003130 [Phrynosoma platyrhinos]
MLSFFRKNQDPKKVPVTEREADGFVLLVDKSSVIDAELLVMEEEAVCLLGYGHGTELHPLVFDGAGFIDIGGGMRALIDASGDIPPHSRLPVSIPQDHLYF